MRPHVLSLIGLLLFAGTNSQAQTVIVPYNATWKYLDNGSNQGTSWRSTTFNDASWASGPAVLGYGNGGESTVISYGSSSSNKYITTYFRKSFNVTGAASFLSYRMDYFRDDGVVIYVNGVEVKRDNMPTGTISYTTVSSTYAVDDGLTAQTATIASSYFVEGSNVIAVELHQDAGSSSDVAFNFKLTGQTTSSPIVITRGPYLQMGNQTAVTLRWRTDIATDSRVRYGTTAGSLTSNVSDAVVTTNHEVRVTGLTADTKYYYSVGTTTAVIEESVDNYFNTAPTPATTRKIRIAAYGDCGNNSSNQANVRNAYLSYMGSNPTDVWLLLGDNAYDNGTDAEYQTKFFPMYKDNLLKNTLLFPATGNHDYANSSSRQDDHNIPYFTIFTLPKNAECGGVASGKEEYYSYDYGDIHFISLDSYGEESNKRFYDTTSAQALWLKNDLAANTRKWTIAYWHHPPYTMGSHNSDTESDLVNTRSRLIRILERNGVDLILCGHSHVYERSYLIKGHFGLENTFSMSSHGVSNSSAKYDGTSNSCPYFTTAQKNNHGMVYVVAGSAGQVGGTSSSYPHAAMYYSNPTNGGSLLLEIEGNRLDAKFIAADNTVKDKFTILKDVKKKTTQNITAGQSATLTASWLGNYSWSTTATTQSITVSPTSGNNMYVVHDNATPASRCVSDTFYVNVLNPFASEEETQIAAYSFALSIVPNPAPNINLRITSKVSQRVQINVSDAYGNLKKTLSANISSGINHQTISVPAGTYIVEVKNTSGEKLVQRALVR